MKAAFNLDHLRVATPCPRAWDDMLGDNRVRFCNHCHLNVYNLAELTQKETQRLISSSGGKLCGRLYRRADGTVLTKDCPVGLQALRKRISRRTAAIFATFLGLSSTVFAQHAKEKDSCQSQIRIAKTQKLNNEKPLLAGSLFDPNGAVIPGAAVLVKNIKTGVTRQVSTNDQGQFTFPSLTEGAYSLTITLAPFKSLLVQEVKLEEKTALNMDITLEISGNEVVGLLIGRPSMIDTPPGSFTISGDLLIRLPH